MLIAPGGLQQKPLDCFQLGDEAMKRAIPAVVLAKLAERLSGRIQMSKDDFDMSIPTKR